MLNFLPDYSKESLGSEEESGKDWDELEEEARKGFLKFVVFILFIHVSMHKFLTHFNILRC